MRAGNIILWRHGQTDYNAAGRLQGQIDIPLNATGREQAERAAQILSRLEPAAIISSDLGRAVETGEALSSKLGVEMEFDVRLRERSFGVWEGLSHEEIRADWPQEFQKWRAGEHPPGINAEPREELGERFAAAVNSWAEKFEISDTLVLVTHGAAISTGITSLLGLDPEGWRGISGLGNCHWSILQPYSGSPQWRLTRHNTFSG